VDNSLWAAHLVLGYAYLYEKQYDQALAEMERAVTLDPRLAENHAGLAVVLSCKGRSEEALLAAEQALGLKPSYADGQFFPVGWAYANEGRLEESIPLFRQYLRRYPNTLGVHLLLAAVYGKLGEAAEARAEAAEVLRLNPQFSLEVERQRVPIKDPAALERYLAALRKAGLK
jgi:adenylate cyclase